MKRQSAHSIEPAQSHPAAGHLVAIACGGTGGHLFPGVAVADSLLARGGAVRLLVSPKEVDQHAVRSLVGLEVSTLPAVALDRGHRFGFFRGFWQSYWFSRRLFRETRPAAVLGMGGFTSAPPILAGRAVGAWTALHEGNTIPGRANRWLAHVVDHAFVHFPETTGRLSHAGVEVIGMPVRPQFQPLEPEPCRTLLGLDPDRPVLLVTGGSQGARGLNHLVLALVPELVQAYPQWQYLHLTGPDDVERVRETYRGLGARACVRAFLTEMEFAIGAATVAVARAGASSLAEFAALGLPAVLVPFPAAAGNHQYYNARAFADAGAARLVQQGPDAPARLRSELDSLLAEPAARERMRAAIQRCFLPQAADRLADAILRALAARPASRVARSGAGAGQANVHPPGSAHPARAGVGLRP